MFYFTWKQDFASNLLSVIADIHIKVAMIFLSETLLYTPSTKKNCATYLLSTSFRYILNIFLTLNMIFFSTFHVRLKL